MKSRIPKGNILFLFVIAILIIPQTRHQIQLVLHKGLSYINGTTVIDKEERKSLKGASWQLVSNNDETLTFSETKGKVIFINFWATWCPPCIVEMPSIQKLYNDYNNQVEFLFVTTDNFETVNKFNKKNEYNFLVYNSVSKIPDKLYTKSIPRTFIINKKGEIVMDESGAVNWNSAKVRSLLNALIKEK